MNPNAEAAYFAAVAHLQKLREDARDSSTFFLGSKDPAHLAIWRAAVEVDRRFVAAFMGGGK